MRDPYKEADEWGPTEESDDLSRFGWHPEPIPGRTWSTFWNVVGWILILIALGAVIYASVSEPSVCARPDLC